MTSMKVKITEFQRLSVNNVRSVCCEHNLYTCGTNEQYEAMFGMVRALAVKQIITGTDLYPIALDILYHSETEHDVASIMWALAEKIYRWFDVEEV